MKFEIKHRFTGSVLFTIETENMRLALEAAVKDGANLRGAHLRGANLGGAHLRGANLGGADLRGANLGGADLRGANLGDAYLRGANLGGAYLGGADLGGADLRGANLGDAYLGGADLGDANLGGAHLRGAKIRDDIEVAQAPIQIGGLTWLVTIWDQHMQIGCEFHSHKEWMKFTKAEWIKMGGKDANALRISHKAALMALCDSHAAKVKEKP